MSRNCLKSFDYEHFIPMVDKSVDPTWKKVVENDRFALSKGVLFMWLFNICILYLSSRCL